MAKRTRKAGESHHAHADTPEPSHESDDSIDLGPVKDAITGFFRKTDAERVVTWALLIAVLAIVLWIRTLPADLPIADDWATNTINQNIRARVSQQVDALYPNLPQENKNQQIEQRTQEFIDQNTDAIEANREQLAGQFRTYFQYQGDDGKQYTYLGDLDSYFWLRFTRNYLTTGTTCGYITEDGRCRDSYPLAPVGVDSSRNPSLHVFLIAYIYEFMTLFNDGYPLLAASFWATTLIGVLGVIPAFFIGRKLAGNVAGVFAGILSALHPLLLSRSLGSDNDAWNITLPLFALWFAIEAIEAKTLRRRIIFAAATGLAIGVHTATWAGWWFGYLILLFGLIGYLVFRGVQHAWLKRNARIWEAEQVVSTFTVLAVFYVVTYLAIIPMGQHTGYFGLPTAAFTAGSSLEVAVSQQYWPNVLTTVAELNKASFGDVIHQMLGPLYFFGCLMGMLLVAMPRTKQWRWTHGAVFFVGIITSWYVVSNHDAVMRFQILTLLAIPVAGALLLQLWKEDEDAHIPAGFLVLVWFLAAVFTSFSGVRFIMLMIPAYAISFGILAGRAYEWATRYLQREIPVHKYIINTVFFLFIAFALFTPVRAGYQTAYAYAPTIDDAWWDALSRIRVESAPDAIINSWWDFGHWFKYVADRRVSADGTTQHTHVPHWLGLSLVTPDERLSVATLRMLDCGSDAYPGPSGDLGAYGLIVGRLEDPIAAEALLREIMVKSKDDARSTLRARGFTASEQDAVLNASHCTPPEDYFITSGDMVGKAGVWAHFGLWDFKRAYVVTHARDHPNMTTSEVVDDFVTHLGYTREEAEQLYYQAKGLENENEINAFVSPWPGYASGWMGCGNVTNTTSLLCPLGISAGEQPNGRTARIDGLIFNATHPAQSRMVYGVWQGSTRVGGIENGTPELIVIAGEKGLLTVRFENPTSPGLALLIEPDKSRVMVVDPRLISSTFTQLFFLDGKYSKYYKKFDDRNSVTGMRIITWKVDWDAYLRDTEAGSGTSRATVRITEGSDAAPAQG